MNGWIKINRSMLEWEHFTEPSVVTVFLALLMTAERDGKTDIKLDELMKYTGISHNTVNRCIAKLVKSGEITREKRGQNIFTTITNWSKFQGNLLTQKLVQCEDSLTQNLGEQEETIIPKNGSIIHPKNGTIIIPKIGSTIYNKNNKKDNKNDVVEDAHARVIENLKTYDYWAESMCKNYHLTHEQLCTKVDEFVLDMACSDKKIEELLNARAYFKAWLSGNINRNNGQRTNEVSGQQSDPRVKLGQDAVKAMAALAAESRHTVEPTW